MFEAVTEIRGGDGQKVSDLHARFGSDVGAIAHLWPTGVATSVRHAITVVVAACALFYISTSLALCIAIFLPMAVFFFLHFSKRLGGLAAEAQASLALSNGILLESLHSTPHARPSGAMEFHRRRLLPSLRESGAKLHRARVRGFAMGSHWERCRCSFPR